jgi:hypothetical protein
MSTTEKAGNDDAQQESSELSAPNLTDFGITEPEAPVVDEKEVAEEAEDEAEETEEELEESSEDTEEEAEETDEDEESEKDVLLTELDIDEIPDEDRVGLANQLLEALSPEQRKEFYKGSKGRMGADMGKARKAKAEAEAETESIKAKYALLEAEKVYGDNPYAAYTDTEKLDEELKNTTAQIKAGRALLRGTDEEFEIAGKYETREWVDQQIDKFEALKDAIPKQKEFLKQKAKAVRKAKDAEAALSDRYSWIEDEDSTESKAYHKMMKDPTWSMALDRVPALASVLPEVLAKFVSAGEVKKASIGKRKLPTRGERKPKGDFGSGGSGAKGSNGSQRKKSKANEQLFSGNATTSDKLAMFA